ncbi:hypothetical protein AAFF_G00083790 [Aldrovandia affinis]|uniref:Secreted protein n=1 Tax=Aldrovandia affinis TaxID=143900 RepID=A0AAD7RXC9_9TELE|nr:hypothetical protein AAFF_G00083790 [Aldrovandia affinis]
MLLTKNKFDFAFLLMSAFLLCTSMGSHGGLPSNPPCRPRFSESFYSVFVSRDILQGQSTLKDELPSPLVL